MMNSLMLIFEYVVSNDHGNTQVCITCNDRNNQKNKGILFIIYDILRKTTCSD